MSSALTQGDVAAFEKRAAEAEARLDALESGSGAGGANSAFSADVLDQLRVLRQQLEAARDEQRKLEEDKTQAEATIRELRTENDKLKYRVLHLVRNARQADQKTPPPPHPPLVRFSTDPFAYKSPLDVST